MNIVDYLVPFTCSKCGHKSGALLYSGVLISHNNVRAIGDFVRSARLEEFFEDIHKESKSKELRFRGQTNCIECRCLVEYIDTCISKHGVIKYEEVEPY